MSRATVTIKRSRQDVWDFLTKAENWATWWGGTLKEVNPSWRPGAVLIWENGNTAEITDSRLYRQFQLTSTSMTTIFQLRDATSRSTIVEIEDTPRSGATFNDGGAAHSKELTSSLEKLREAMERGAPKTAAKRTFWDIVNRISIAVFCLYLLFFLVGFIAAIFGWSSTGSEPLFDGFTLAMILIIDIVVFFISLYKSSLLTPEQKRLIADQANRRPMEEPASNISDISRPQLPYPGPPRTAPGPKPSTWICSMCGGYVRSDATFCKHCKAQFVGHSAPALDTALSSATPHQSLTHNVPQRIEIRNSYGHFDNSPLIVEAHPNLEQILTSPEPPVVQKRSKDNEAHWAQAPAEERRMMAIIGYLQHPDPDVRKAVMPYTSAHNVMIVDQALIDRLGGDADPIVRQAAADTIWARQKEVHCKYVVAALQDEIQYGSEQAMIGPTRAKRALQLLLERAPDMNARAAVQELMKQ